MVKKCAISIFLFFSIYEMILGFFFNSPRELRMNLLWPVKGKLLLPGKNEWNLPLTLIGDVTF